MIKFPDQTETTPDFFSSDQETWDEFKLAQIVVQRHTQRFQTARTWNEITMIQKILFH